MMPSGPPPSSPSGPPNPSVAAGLQAAANAQQTGLNALLAGQRQAQFLALQQQLRSRSQPRRHHRLRRRFMSVVILLIVGGVGYAALIALSYAHLV